MSRLHFILEAPFSTATSGLEVKRPYQGTAIRGKSAFLGRQLNAVNIYFRRHSRRTDLFPSVVELTTLT